MTFINNYLTSIVAKLGFKRVNRVGLMARKSKKSEESLGFTKINYILLAVGLGLIVIGYILLSVGDITGAPILLVLGYCAVLPLAILYGKKVKSTDEATGVVEPEPNSDN